MKRKMAALNPSWKRLLVSVVSVVPQAELCEVAIICFVLDHGKVTFTDKN